MTPERWNRVADLFHEALAIASVDRAAWVREECGDDDELKLAVSRLLNDDARATDDAFLLAPEAPDRLFSSTVSWTSIDGGNSSYADARDKYGWNGSANHSGGFAPKAAIYPAAGSQPLNGNRSLEQQRLRDLTIVYWMIVGLMLVWKYGVVGDSNASQAIPYVVVLSGLGAIVFRLSRSIPLSESSLRVLELGMIGMVAVAFAFAQYQTMLDFSLRGDPVRAQLVMKNRVLVTAVLILSYGIYAPKNWYRAALVVGPLAILPFVTLLLLYLRYPVTMGWLMQVGLERDTTPVALFGFDAMILMILAVGSASGARTISGLRRQVREARQLGQYRLRQRLGTGGMGEVYLAEHQLLKRPCALKLIRPGVDSDPDVLRWFEREVRLTATLSHPNTVEIYDYGRTEEGTYYYVMEYLRGLSLEDLVEQHGPLPPGRAVYLLRQVCLALREAHAAGLIHRDIKPSNIFASRRGGMDDVAKLFDFGLVLPLMQNGSYDADQDGRVFGTPLFMPPEQAAGASSVDARSDIYSLGAVAYHLVTGHPPFEGLSGFGLLISHACEPVVPPSQVRSGIPEDLERIVLRCMAKDAGDRFDDAESLERALGECECAGDWDQKLASRWWREVEQGTTLVF